MRLHLSLCARVSQPCVGYPRQAVVTWNTIPELLGVSRRQQCSYCWWYRSCMTLRLMRFSANELEFTVSVLLWHKSGPGISVKGLLNDCFCFSSCESERNKSQTGAAGIFTAARTENTLALLAVPLSRTGAEGDHGQASEQPALILLSFLSVFHIKVW